jgi:hypothetical protein
VTTHESDVPPDGTRQRDELEAHTLEYGLVPWPLAAAGLLALVAAMLGIGLASNALLRGQTPLGAQRTPTAGLQIAVMGTSVPTMAPAPTTTLTASARVILTQATATLVPSSSFATETQTVSMTVQTAQAQIVPTQQANTGGGGTVTADKGGLRSTPVPTVDSEVAAEVVAAYKHYWDVRADALLNLDPTHLPEVSADPHLTVLQDGIEQLKSEGHAIRTDVQLNFRVLSTASNIAIVADNVIDSSVYVDPETREPLTDDDEANKLTAGSKVEFKMQRFDDTWKVVDSVDVP